DQRRTVFHSSGTTEQRPSRHFHSPQSLKLYESSCWAWFAHNLLTEEIPPELVILAPRPGHAPHSSLVHMLEAVRVKMKANAAVFLGQVEPNGAWTLDFEVALSELLTPFPKLVLGTAFSFVHLFDYLAES